MTRVQTNTHSSAFSPACQYYEGSGTSITKVLVPAVSYQLSAISYNTGVFFLIAEGI
jgi:hypothetical protein